MSTDIDWTHELDRSFGTGEDVPVGHYVAAGQQAVRRRRATWSAAGIAAAVVLALGATLGPGGAPSGEAPLATDPSSTPSPTSPPTASEEPTTSEDTSTPASSLPWRKGDPPARASPDGLEIREGAIVHERRDDLFPGKATSSVALDISFRGSRWWMSLEWDESSAGYISTKPEDGLHDSFDDFVRAEIRTGGMTKEPAPADDRKWLAGLVQWTGGEVRTRAGVVVVEQVDQPVTSDLPSLGLVVRKDGVTTWMLIMDGGGSATWTDAAGSGWATFEEWLAEQVALQAGTPEPQLVTLDDDGTVTAAQAGVVVLEQQADPDLRAYGTEAEGAASAVALVEWKQQRWFVLAIRDGSQTFVTPVVQAKAGGARTLDEFVAFMADRADEGGMR